jgi:hypothetical protein
MSNFKFQINNPPSPPFIKGGLGGLGEVRDDYGTDQKLY